MSWGSPTDEEKKVHSELGHYWDEETGSWNSVPGFADNPKGCAGKVVIATVVVCVMFPAIPIVIILWISGLFN